MLTCLNQHRAAMAICSKAVLLSSNAATSIPGYVSGWCGHGFKSYSLSFLLTYPKADINL